MHYCTARSYLSIVQEYHMTRTDIFQRVGVLLGSLSHMLDTTFDVR
jgi:hypothetical protein